VYPKNFLWGLSTSAFQIEGYIQNDMTEWEKSGNFKQNGDSPEYNNAVGHWKTWESDFKLLKKIGANSYRFSIDWGRAQPAEGIFDEKVLDQYDRMIDYLIQLKIEPMLTIHHFTHPIWFHAKTPWHHPASIDSYSKFVEKLIQRFGEKIKLYITFNEPVVWALAAYGDGKFPPGEKNFDTMALALNHILQAHKRAYEIIKDKYPDSQVGVANNFIMFRPQRLWHLLDRGTTFLIHRFYNFFLLDAFRTNKLSIIFPFLIHYDHRLSLKDSIDFWGINYYYRLHTRFCLNFKRPMEFSHINRSGEGFSDLGWEIYSKGLWEVIKWINNTGKPFYITENGVADARDNIREKFIKSHLKIVEKAVSKNLPLRGYFYWSLMDNYEWLVGKKARFGLYEVDYSNHMTRQLRKSGKFFSDYITQNIAE
jgi:beta-glucosidase